MTEREKMFIELSKEIELNRMSFTEKIVDFAKTTLKLYSLNLAIFISVILTFYICGGILGLVPKYDIIEFTIKYFYSGNFFGFVMWRIHLFWLFLCGLFTILE